MKKFLYVDATSGYYTEANAFESTDFIASSAGAGDAGKPIKTDANGHVDSTFIDYAGFATHSNLNGLSADDHTQYILVAGTRAFTGDQSMGGNQLTSVGDPTTTTIDSASNDAIPMSFLASTTSGKGASKIGIEDSANYFASNNVEGALAELAGAIPGTVLWTVGTGGVTKGDAVFVSADNTVSTLATISNDDYVIGLAEATVAAAGTVKVAPDDFVLTGVLTSATAGAKYYWTGSGFSTTAPATAGQNVWRVGVAKNASDLYIDVKQIKKNA